MAPFSAAGVAALRAKGHGLVVTGKVWEALAAVEPAAWSVAGEVRVYARMSPEGKEAWSKCQRHHASAATPAPLQAPPGARPPAGSSGPEGRPSDPSLAQALPLTLTPKPYP